MLSESLDVLIFYVILVSLLLALAWLKDGVEAWLKKRRQRREAGCPAALRARLSVAQRENAALLDMLRQREQFDRS
ncbi:MAG: hypothetical protein ACREBC_13330 [Pyrinomonadaceae bacterium]